ncbi:hypothetical protein GYA28_02695 [Candidatus Roizmanbacteria bacterium]|jgi:hypothetical protein|nr:hypothetical protein [Candidatus Roizmanbacteria bacterium]
MRKILQIIILIVGVILITSKVRADVPSPTPTSSIPIPTIVVPSAVISSAPMLPGVNCGDTYATSPNNRCCVHQPIVFSIPRPNVIGIDQIVDVVNPLVDSILRPLFSPFNNYAQSIVQPCVSGFPSTPGDLTNPSCVCNASPPQAPLTQLLYLCKNVSPKEQGQCESCLKGTGSSGTVGVWTGIGCIYTDFGTFIKEKVFGFGVGMAGIVALLCIIYAAFSMQTSRGNAEKIKKAQEMLTSCIMGLMLVIFSIFILRLIGVNILKIPGFS